MPWWGWMIIIVLILGFKFSIGWDGKDKKKDKNKRDDDRRLESLIENTCLVVDDLMTHTHDENGNIVLKRKYIRLHEGSGVVFYIEDKR